MALTTVYGSMAQQPQGYLPLLLASVTFGDGTILYLSSSPLSTAEGGAAYGVQYAGNNYLARLGQQELAQVQALSPQGITLIPNVSLNIADPDSSIYLSWEMAAGKGFKGSTVALDLVLYDAINKAFSSDSVRKFVGTCELPKRTRRNLTVQATSLKNPQRVSVPSIHLQPRCWKTFPINLVQRQSGADDRSSQTWDCGYSPDADNTLGNVRGNLIGGIAAVVCNHTRQNCALLGMFDTDGSARVTRRFGGFEWNGPTGFNGKSYLDGKTIVGYNFTNDARFNDLIAIMYGPGWIDLAVLQPLGDPNSTRFEAIVCYGEIGSAGIDQVVANGVIIPQNNSDQLFTWRYVNRTGSPGDRTGGFNTDAIYNGLGDPYGSITVIEIVVPTALAQSGGLAQVKAKVLSGDKIGGPKIPIPNSNTTTPAGVAAWPRAATTNPVWILLDLLTWCNYVYSDIDMASWRAAAAYCDTVINYTDSNGAASTHARYKAQLILRQKRSAADVIQGLLNSFQGILVPNNSGALLQLFIRQTLADQQPSGTPITGSNGTAIASITAAGVAANGLPAFVFDESNVIASSVETVPLTAAESGNQIGITFQDEDNNYQQDSVSQTDALAVAGAGNQEIPISYPVDGILNFDQANRIMNVRQAQLFRGNPRGDARGAVRYQFDTTSLALHLHIGQLIRFSWQQDGISLQLFRIESIKLYQNAEKMQLLVSWHSDGWYQDTYGQSADPFYSDPRMAIPLRPAYPWKPDGESAANVDLYLPGTIFTYSSFAIAAGYVNQADGSPETNLTINGRPPCNKMGTAFPPNVPQTGSSFISTPNTGGTIAPGTYLVGFSSIDAAGGWSTLSKLLTVVVPAGTSTNRIIVGGLYWPSLAVDGAVFVGSSELTLATNGRLGAVSSSLTLTGIPNPYIGPPDIKFDHFHVQTQIIEHSGIIGSAISAIGTGTLQIPGYGPSAANLFLDYVVSFLGWGTPTDSLFVPILDSRITASSSDVNGNLNLTLHQDFLSTGVGVGDVVVIRAKSDNITSSTIGCALFINAFSPGGITTAAGGEANLLIKIIAGTGAGQARTIKSNTSTVYTINGTWDTLPDATSYFIVLDPSVQFQKPSATMTVTDAVPAAPLFLSGNYVNNPLGETLLVSVLTEDVNNVSGPDSYMPFREIYVPGTGLGQADISVGTYAVKPTDQVLSFTAGTQIANLPSQTVVRRKQLFIINRATAGNVVVNALTGETIDGVASKSIAPGEVMVILPNV